MGSSTVCPELELNDENVDQTALSQLNDVSAL